MINNPGVEIKRIINLLSSGECSISISTELTVTGRTLLLLVRIEVLYFQVKNADPYYQSTLSISLPVHQQRELLFALMEAINSWLSCSEVSKRQSHQNSQMLKPVCPRQMLSLKFNKLLIYWQLVLLHVRTWWRTSTKNSAWTSYILYFFNLDASTNRRNLKSVNQQKLNSIFDLSLPNKQNQMHRYQYED